MTVPTPASTTVLAALPSTGARRIVYFGTPDVAVPALRALVDAGVEVALVVTREDKRRGRGAEVSPSPVKQAAIELGLEVSHDMNDAVSVHADLGVVVAYGRIIPKSLLVQLPMINVHFSLLPRWRGAAPVERALLAGDRETGICIMRVEEGLDTGVVYDKVALAIHPEHTLSTLRNELVAASLTPLINVVQHGAPAGQPQVGEPTHAAKIQPQDLEIRFTMTARDIVARVALETAWFDLAGTRVRVTQARVAKIPVASERESESGSQGTRQRARQHSPGDVISVDGDGVLVACAEGVSRVDRADGADGAVLLVRVQPAGKKPMSAAAWANGARLPASLA